jgi:hypothetical protein
MFPTLDAKAAGFKVYAVIDASGDPCELVLRTTLARFASPTRQLRNSTTKAAPNQPCRRSLIDRTIDRLRASCCSDLR